MNDPMENSGDYSPCEPLLLTVPDSCSGKRLDLVLAELMPQHSRNRLQNWIRDQCVEVDSELATEPKRKVMGGQQIALVVPTDTREHAEQPEDIPLDIIFEDEALLVINKPPGLVVHPGSGNWTGTLMNALLHHLPSIADIPRAGIVHRLDKDTSGLLVVAKTLEAQTNLVRQLQARTVKRQYLALAAGVIRRDSGVEAPIGRHPVNRIKMAIIPENRGGKPALTWYRRLELFNYCTLLECALETGRTHQIRVHMASIGHALVGDQVYGKHDPRLPVFHRQALHATRLGLMHPLSGRQVQWEVPMPQDMRELLDTLRYG